MKCALIGPDIIAVIYMICTLGKCTYTVVWNKDSLNNYIINERIGSKYVVIIYRHRPKIIFYTRTGALVAFTVKLEIFSIDQN